MLYSLTIWYHVTIFPFHMSMLLQLLATNLPQLDFLHSFIYTFYLVYNFYYQQHNTSIYTSLYFYMQKKTTNQNPPASVQLNLFNLISIQPNPPPTGCRIRLYLSLLGLREYRYLLLCKVILNPFLHCMKFQYIFANLQGYISKSSQAGTLHLPRLTCWNTRHIFITASEPFVSNHYINIPANIAQHNTSSQDFLSPPPLFLHQSYCKEQLIKMQLPPRIALVELLLAAAAAVTSACNIPTTPLSSNITGGFGILIQNPAYPVIHDRYMNLAVAGGGDKHLFLSPVGDYAFDLDLNTGFLEQDIIHAVIDGEVDS